MSAAWQFIYALSFLALAAGVPALYLSRGLHVDESLYLVVGQQVADGSTLYVDVIDHKPPAIFYLAAGASTLVEQPHVPLRLLSYGVVAVTGLLVLRLGTRLYDAEVGMLASLLYVLGSYLPHFDGFGFMTEQYVALCTVVAASLFVGRGARRSDVGVGLALGVGVLFNQAVFLFGGAILVYFAISVVTADRRGAVARESLGRTLTIGAGFLLVVALTLAAFAANGTLGPFVEYSLVVPLTEYDPPFDLSGHVWMTLSYLPVWALAGGGVLLAVWTLFRDQRADRLLFVACWAVLLSYPGMTQFAGDHKMLYVFPPVALLAAATLRWLWSRATFSWTALTPPYRGISSSQVATIALVLVAVFAVAAGGFNVIYSSTMFGESIDDQRETAQGVDEYADGQLYTFPFAFDLVYFGDGVSSPEMYVGGIYSPELANQVTGTLEAKQVPYVAVHENYVTESGAIEGSGYFAESEGMVGDYIAANYERVGTSGKYVVYERTGESSADVERDADVVQPADVEASASRSRPAFVTGPRPAVA